MQFIQGLSWEDKSLAPPTVHYNRDKRVSLNYNEEEQAQTDRKQEYLVRAPSCGGKRISQLTAATYRICRIIWWDFDCITINNYW